MLASNNAILVLKVKDLESKYEELGLLVVSLDDLKKRN